MYRTQNVTFETKNSLNTCAGRHDDSRVYTGHICEQQTKANPNAVILTR